MVETTVKVTCYENYKDSGLAWLGEIPEHWETKRIKYIFNEINERSEDGSEDLLSVSQYTGVTNKSNKVEAGGMLTNAETLEGYKKVAKGDLVSNIMLAWNGSLGFSPFEGITSPAYSIYRIKDNNDNRYFHYLLRTELYKAEFKRNSSGVIESRLRLYTDDFFKIESILPPLQEQTKIAQFLDDKTTKIDEAIAIKEQQIRLLKERKQILIHKAVTRGLNDNVKLKDSGVEWIGEIPEHWEVKKFKHTFYEKKKTTNLSLNCGSISYGKVVYKDDKTVPEFTKKSYQVLSIGDFLINPLNLNYDLVSLRIALSDKNVVVSSGYIIVKNIFEINKEYFKWLLHIFDILYMKTLGSGVRQTLSFTHIANSNLVFPPLSEQKEISAYIEKASQKIETAINLKQQEIEKLKEYKNSLINGVVTGKVRVC